MYKYNIEVLLNAANEYFYAESDYQRTAIKYKALKRGGEYYNDPRKYDREYDMVYNCTTSAWYKLNDMCDLVGADIKAVSAVAKAIRRNSQYKHGWSREARFYSDSWARYYPDGERHDPGSDTSFFMFCKKEA